MSVYGPRILVLCLVLSFHRVRTVQSAGNSSAECCSTCIGKTSNTPYSYDPVIFDQCSSVNDGVCCFECGSLGDPTFGDTITYGDDGVTAVVKAGTFISFTWSGVSNVTYISLKKGQKKIITPTISDTAADEKSDTFLICARSAGTIYFRGWGSDPCREASQEHSVTVEASDASADTCNADDVVVPNSDSDGSPKDDTVDDCNPQRASVQVVDGTRTCVCVSDWSNPPECDRWPLWKWLVTIGGGVAALFSIIISIRAFLAGRKKKEEAAYEATLAPVGAKSSVETLTVTPESGYHEDGMPSYKYNPETDRITGAMRKAEDREFTL